MLTPPEIDACRRRLRMADETIEWISDTPAGAILVGESPLSERDHALPLFPTRGSDADRLRSMVGLSRDTFLGFFERRHLIAHTVESWPAGEAVEAAWLLLEQAAGRPIVALGARVAHALAVAAGGAGSVPAAPPAFEWFDLGAVAGGAPAIRIPHPGGLARSYTAEVRARAAAAVADVVRRALPNAARRLVSRSTEVQRRLAQPRRYD